MWRAGDEWRPRGGQLTHYQEPGEGEIKKKLVTILAEGLKWI